MKEFKKRFFGKWVLAGEYSVLRDCPALVYPLPRYYMDFEYKPSNYPLQIKRQGEYQVGLEFCVDPLFEKALKLIGKKRDELKGSLTLKGFIPFGAGLGASSVICCGVASLFLFKNWIPQQKLKPFATTLEDFFHGKSSGMDIYAVLDNKALIYQIGKTPSTLVKSSSKFFLFLSYSGGRSSTSSGLSQVKALFENNWTLAQQVDKNMKHSVELCVQALKAKDPKLAKNLLAKALTLGENCFRKWKLISYDLEQHTHYLKQKGALATKPTGSGLGGHVISLWDKAPPPSIQGLIPLQI